MQCVWQKKNMYSGKIKKKITYKKKINQARSLEERAERGIRSFSMKGEWNEYRVKDERE